MPNPTIVSAALSDEKLRESISKLVEDYKKSLNDMKTATTNAVKDIQETIKSIGSTKVDFSGTLDGLEKAKKKMATAASGGVGGGGGSSTKDSVVAPKTIGELEESIRLEEKKRKEMKLGTDELREQNKLIEEQKAKLKQETESVSTRLRKIYNKDIGNTVSLPSRTLSDAEYKLRELERLMSDMRGKGFISVQQINRVQNAIDSVKNKIERLRSKKPMTMQEVLGMDESSIEAIARKMQALKRITIDPQNAQQVKQLGEEYTRLGKKQSEYLGKNLLIQKSNHMLASTFGYIRNRIIYAFTLGALASFFRDLRNIRAEYEMLDRSLGILVGDFERGTRIFNELNEMALKSPFTLIELGTAAKQLTAYNFAADEVVDTTRRIADISAALGVPIERLVYNLGQIKAQGSLTARDARDFANAGLAIVPMLADMYTKQKAFGKELTTTADVYDMMSKKMVSYGDVLKVIQQVTDEGGKFFNFQARQADTLKVQMANLSLAYNNMMNEIGADNQGLLSGSIRMVRSLFENWKTVANVIQQLIITFGTYKATAIVVTALNSRMFVGSILVNLRNYIAGIKAATGAMATFNAVTKLNPIGFLAAALASVAGYFLLFRDNVQEVSQEVEMFGESAAKSINKVLTLQKILQGSANTSSTYKKTLSELSNVMSEYGVKLDAEKANRDEINKATEQTIQLIKEEAAERQRANNIAKGEENYNKGIKDAKDAFYSEISNISDLTDIGGQTKKFRKELEDNAQAISDVVATIVEDNISLVVGKSGDEAKKGMLEIQEKVSGAMSSMGISSKATQYLLYNTDILRDLIIQTRRVSEEQINYNNSIDSYYNNSKKLTESTMTFTQKVEANSRALQNNTNDALSLYNKIYDIVKIAQQNHTINFDLKLTADNPPKWMLDKSLPELQRLAQRFAAIAQSGGHVEGYDREGTYQQALRYASAARQKQEEADRAARMKNNTKTKKERDAILDTIKEEISLTKKLQGEYDKLTSKGASHADAIKDIEKRYTNTIKLLDVDLGKFNLPKFDTSIITGKDPNKQLEYYKKLRDVLESKGLLNLDRAKVVDAVIQELDVSAKTFNLDKITKGLNNELDRLKDEYELAVSLDADPELGSMFADWMGIDVNDLPRTASEYAERASKILNKDLKELGAKVDLPNLLSITDDDMRELEKSKTLTQEQLELVKKRVSESREFYRKETDDRIKNWDKLLEKYSEYEYKIRSIENNAAKERRDLIMKAGDEDEKRAAIALHTTLLEEIDPQARQKLINKLSNLATEVTKENKTAAMINVAIGNRETKDKAKVGFEEFQKSPEWIVATGDLAGMTDRAIGGLINSLEKYKKTAKNLDPKQIKQINNALKNLYRQQRQGNPFLAIANSMDEAKGRYDEYEGKIKDIEKELDVLYNSQDASNLEETGKKIAELTKNLRQYKKEQEDLGEVDTKTLIDAFQGVLSYVNQCISAVGELTSSLGDTQLSKQLNDVAGVFEKFGKGAQMGSAFGVYGAVIGAVAGAAIGLAGVINGNEDITNNIHVHEVAIERLNVAYKKLESSINDAYGAELFAAKETEISYKKQLLYQKERQLELEKSRSSKNQDSQEIARLSGEIEDLKNEIDELAKSISTELLGISSVGDAAENMVTSMIDAFKKGEDYMAKYSESFGDMVDNMIMKTIVSRVIGDRLSNLLEQVDVAANERAKKEKEDYERVLQQYQTFERYAVADALFYKSFDPYSEFDYFSDAYQNAQEISKEEWEGLWKKRLEYYKKLYTDAATPTPSDVESVKNDAQEWRNDVEKEFKEWMNVFGVEYGEEAESSKNELNALQQGIQSVSEPTANAIEAYLNGMSQQAYLRNDLLTQIRDAVVSFNLDVQVATMSQILLQLQSSYAVQMAIQGILEGWSSPSGLAVRVEMQ